MADPLKSAAWGRWLDESSLKGAMVDGVMELRQTQPSQDELILPALPDDRQPIRLYPGRSKKIVLTGGFKAGKMTIVDSKANVLLHGDGTVGDLTVDFSGQPPDSGSHIALTPKVHALTVDIPNGGVHTLSAPNPPTRTTFRAHRPLALHGLENQAFEQVHLESGASIEFRDGLTTVSDLSVSSGISLAGKLSVGRFSVTGQSLGSRGDGAQLLDGCSLHILQAMNISLWADPHATGIELTLGGATPQVPAADPRCTGVSTHAIRQITISDGRTTGLTVDAVRPPAITVDPNADLSRLSGACKVFVADGARFDAGETGPIVVRLTAERGATLVRIDPYSLDRADLDAIANADAVSFDWSGRDGYRHARAGFWQTLEGILKKQNAPASDRVIVHRHFVDASFHESPNISAIKALYGLERFFGSGCDWKRPTLIYLSATIAAITALWLSLHANRRLDGAATALFWDLLASPLSLLRSDAQSSLSAVAAQGVFERVAIFALRVVQTTSIVFIVVSLRRLASGTRQ